MRVSCGHVRACQSAIQHVAEKDGKIRPETWECLARVLVEEVVQTPDRKVGLPWQQDAHSADAQRIVEVEERVAKKLEQGVPDPGVGDLFSRLEIHEDVPDRPVGVGPSRCRASEKARVGPILDARRDALVPLIKNRRDDLMHDCDIDDQRFVDAHHKIDCAFRALDLPAQVAGERVVRAAPCDALAPCERNRRPGEAQRVAVRLPESEIGEIESFLQYLVDVLSLVEHAGIHGKAVEAFFRHRVLAVEAGQVRPEAVVESHARHAGVALAILHFFGNGKLSCKRGEFVEAERRRNHFSLEPASASQRELRGTLVDEMPNRRLRAIKVACEGHEATLARTCDMPSLLAGLGVPAMAWGRRVPIGLSP